MFDSFFIILPSKQLYFFLFLALFILSGEANAATKNYKITLLIHMLITYSTRQGNFGTYRVRSCFDF